MMQNPLDDTPAPITTRVSVLAYGVLSYAFFFGTFLYALGFVGGFGVPTSLDSAPSGSFWGALAVNLGLLTVFALQHSVMARAPFKRWLTRWIPTAAERSTYVLLSSVALCLLFWQWRPMGGLVWQVEHPLATGLLYAGFAFGWLRGRPYENLRFVTPGPYRLVRHPLYLGWLFAFWCTPTMTGAHLVFALATTAYILIAIRLEERDLIAFHGADYERYRAQVPMIIPRLPGGSQPAAGAVGAARAAGQVAPAARSGAQAAPTSVRNAPVLD